MRHTIKVVLFSTFLVIVLIITSTQPAKTNQSAPPAGGLSGDPSRTSCALIGCHFGTTYTFGPGQLTLNMGDTDINMTPMSGQTYTPGKTYYIEFMPNLTNGSNTRYGFQMTSLDAAGNMLGSFGIVDANRTAAQSLLSRNYIGHKDADRNNDWTFQWTAPATNSGDITFYYAANIANGNADNSGDSIYLGTLILSPSSTTGLSETDYPVQSLSMFPNPARDFINISFQNPRADHALVLLYTLDGKMVQSNEYNLQSGFDDIKHSFLTSIAPGIYLLELQAGKCRSSQRIVIM